MRGQRSPYTVLGLRPGADRAAVDEAYRRLMKQHHPDLPGGSADSAAELNRAYDAIRGEAPPAPLPAVIENPVRGGRRPRTPGRVAGLLMLVAAAAIMLLLPLPADQPRTSGNRPAAQHSAGQRIPLPDTFDMRSLPDEDAITTAVLAAQRLRQSGFGSEAVAFSQSCDGDLKTFPSPSLLDHCVAFDAAVGLMAGDRAGARFRAEDMAARHVGAALRVSNDPVLAEERVGSVRRRVEQMLAQPAP